MRKNLAISGSIILAILLIFSRCQKEINEKPAEAEAEALLRGDHGGDKNECRLVFATNSDITGIFDFTFHYNKKGLADEWNMENYGLFKMEYDGRGKLKKVTLLQNGVVSYTMALFYKRDKVVKETYYGGTGTEITDEAYYSYNALGKIIKLQSFMGDYVATAKYDREGNLTASELFFSGIPAYGAFYTYKQHFKNPYLAIPGIDHAFPFYTPADFFSSNVLYQSLKQVGYDENGQQVVIFEYDPSKTALQPGPHNYPGSVTYFDILSGGTFPYNYEFENCGRNWTNDHRPSPTVGPSTTPGARIMNPMLFLKRGSTKTLKEQIKEWRKQLLNKR